MLFSDSYVQLEYLIFTLLYVGHFCDYLAILLASAFLSLLLRWTRPPKPPKCQAVSSIVGDVIQILHGNRAKDIHLWLWRFATQRALFGWRFPFAWIGAVRFFFSTFGRHWNCFFGYAPVLLLVLLLFIKLNWLFSCHCFHFLPFTFWDRKSVV